MNHVAPTGDPVTPPASGEEKEQDARVPGFPDGVHGDLPRRGNE